MKNLKKVLALVLAFACAFTMFAGAAFTDSADIKVKSEVVDTLVELGVIQGYDDGSFRPNETVTRAQMAKMIYVLRTGNSDASAYNDDYTTFTDISTHWGRGYIKYCQSLGIIAGKSATVFAPDVKVTTQEAAKMLLVTLGYDAKKAGLVGTGWASKTNALADENGLLEDVNTSFSGPCPRQYAAQLIYNTIDAPTVVWRDDAYHHTNVLDKDNQTVGEKYMSLKKTTSTLTDVTKTSGKDTYTITLDNNSDIIDWDNTTENVNPLTQFTDVKKDYTDLLYKTVTVLHKDRKTVFGVYATDDNTQQSNILKKLEMDGAKVKLGGTKYDLAATSKQTVYVNGDALYKTSSGTFTTTATGNTKATIKDFVDTYGNKPTSGTKFENSKYWQGTEVSLMATDGTSNYSILKVKTFAVGKVTAVGSDYVNVTYKKGDSDIITKTKLEDDDWDWYDGIKKDDYVVVSAAGNYGSGNGLVEKAEVVTGKVTGTKSDDGVSVGGNWYTMAGNGTSFVKRPNTGSNVDMVVVNGYVYYTDTTAGNVDDMALLIEAAAKGGTGSQWEARMLFADGSEKTVTIEKYWDDKDNKAFPILPFSEGTAANPNVASWTTTATTSVAAAPILVSYEVSGDVYTLSRVGIAAVEDNANKGDFALNGYDAYVDATTGLMTDGSIKQSDKTGHGTSDMKIYTQADTNGLKKGSTDLSRLYYESTGVVFVKYKATAGGTDADYKVISGKTAADYNKAIGNVAAVANKSGNSYYAQVAFIDLQQGTTGGSDDNYAVVMDDVVKDTNDGTKYIVTAWNGSENITIKTDDSTVKNLKSGALITYSGDLNDADVTVKADRDDNNYFVSNYDAASGDINLMSGTLTADASVAGKYTGALTSAGSTKKFAKVDSKDTIVMFVNSDDSEGVTGLDYTNINLAYAFDSDFCTTTDDGHGNYTITGLSEDAKPNVKAYFDDDDQITVLVVDVNRNITQW